MSIINCKLENCIFYCIFQTIIFKKMFLEIKFYSLKRLAAIFALPKHAASRLHLLHLSIDFSGSVIGAGSSVVTEGACPYGWTGSLPRFFALVSYTSRKPPQANRNQVQLSRGGFWTREKSASSCSAGGCSFSQ